MFTNYEISDDLTRVHLQYLERKYGGRLRAHGAATKIQRAYRHYRLYLQWRQVLLNQAPNSSRSQISIEIKNEKNFSSKTIDRNTNFQNLAKSQPALKYQPLTSLRAQLRAERRDSTTLVSHSNNEQIKNITSNSSVVYVESPISSITSKSLAKQRPYIELMSPRLSQKQMLSSICQLKYDDSTKCNIFEKQQSSPTTIVMYDIEQENNNDKKSSLSVTTEIDYAVGATGFFNNGNYHRSVSPHLHSIFEERSKSPVTNTINYDKSSMSPNHRNISINNNYSPVLLPSDCKQNFQKNSPQKVRMEYSVNTSGYCIPICDTVSAFKTTVTPSFLPSPYIVNNSSRTQNLSSFYFSPNRFIHHQPSTPSTTLGCISYNTGSLPRMNNINSNIVTVDVKNIKLPQCTTINENFSLQKNAIMAKRVASTTANGRSLSSGRRNPHLNNVVNSTVISFGDKNQIKSQQPIVLQNLQKSSNQLPATRFNIPLQMRGWTEQQRRRLYRIGLNFFNKKPDRGLQLLINWGYVHESSQAIARFFLERRGLSKQMIGEFLGTIKSPFHFAILESFVNEIPMYDMDIDMALRQLLTNFRLPGEAQKIDHIMQVFARHYQSCNPDRLPSHISFDTVYILAFAIIMLNTDLHTPSLKDSKRMKLEEFVKNIIGIEDGQHLDKKMLQGIYERVKEFEFRSGSDHVTQVMKVDQSIIGKDKPKLVEPHRRLICYCRLHQVIDSNKKQTANAHQREVYLFNDLILVGKLSKKKVVAQHTLKYWTTLIGLRVESFQNLFYNYGLLISCPDGQNFIFNAKNEDDRFHFMADLRESVSEATEMEKLRIELELDKQNGGGKSFLSKNWCALNYENPSNDVKSEENSNATAQRDSGLPDLDQPSISSLSSSCTPQRLNEEKDLINGEDNDNSNELDEITDVHIDPSSHGPNFTTHNSNSLKNGTRFCRFMNNQTSSDIYLKNNSGSPSGSTSTLPSSITTFNSSNSVTSACSVSFSSNTSNGIIDNNKAINLRKNNTESTNNNCQNSLSMPQSSVINVSKVCIGSGNVNNNRGTSRISHRLSFNSLDSGMVEEAVDYPT